MAEATCFGITFDPQFYGWALEAAILLAIPLIVGLIAVAAGWLKP